MMSSCNFENEGYSAGNIGSITDIPNNANKSLLLKYQDSLQMKGEFVAPKKWEDEAKSTYSHLKIRVYYFKKNPEEMYMISFNGPTVLRHVYKKGTGWLCRENHFAKEEILRMRMRYINEVLSAAAIEAKKDGVPDSLIYFDLKKYGRNLVNEETYHVPSADVH